MVPLANQNNGNALFAAFPHNAVQRPNGSAGAVPQHQALRPAGFLHLGGYAVAAQQHHAALGVLHPFHRNDALSP